MFDGEVNLELIAIPISMTAKRVTRKKNERGENVMSMDGPIL